MATPTMLLVLLLLGCFDRTLHQLEDRSDSLATRARLLAADPKTSPESLSAAFARVREADSAVARYRRGAR